MSGPQASEPYLVQSRREVLTVLQDCMRKTPPQHSPIIRVSGSPGQGKTFLLRQAVESLEDSATIVVSDFSQHSPEHSLLNALADALSKVNSVLAKEQGGLEHFATSVGRVLLGEAIERGSDWLVGAAVSVVPFGSVALEVGGIVLDVVRELRRPDHNDPAQHVRAEALERLARQLDRLQTRARVVFVVDEAHDKQPDVLALAELVLATTTADRPLSLLVGSEEPVFLGFANAEARDTRIPDMSVDEARDWLTRSGNGLTAPQIDSIVEKVTIPSALEAVAGSGPFDSRWLEELGRVTNIAHVRNAYPKLLRRLDPDARTRLTAIAVCSTRNGLSTVPSGLADALWSAVDAQSQTQFSVFGLRVGPADVAVMDRVMEHLVMDDFENDPDWLDGVPPALFRDQVDTAVRTYTTGLTKSRAWGAFTMGHSPDLLERAHDRGLVLWDKELILQILTLVVHHPETSYAPRCLKIVRSVMDGTPALRADREIAATEALALAVQDMAQSSAEADFTDVWRRARRRLQGLRGVERERAWLALRASEEAALRGAYEDAILLAAEAARGAHWFLADARAFEAEARELRIRCLLATGMSDAELQEWRSLLSDCQDWNMDAHGSRWEGIRAIFPEATPPSSEQRDDDIEREVGACLARAEALRQTLGEGHPIYLRAVVRAAGLLVDRGRTSEAAKLQPALQAAGAHPELDAGSVARILDVLHLG